MALSESCQPVITSVAMWRCKCGLFVKAFTETDRARIEEVERVDAPASTDYRRGARQHFTTQQPPSSGVAQTAIIKGTENLSGK
jgi:hypothetical protein